MNFEEIRLSSCKLASKFGFKIPNNLPLLKSIEKPRKGEDIVARSLIISVVVAVSYGFKKSAALSWLEQESLINQLSCYESEFLNGSNKHRQQFQVQVEALCAFAWALQLLSGMDFTKRCPDCLVSIYPDFKKMESSNRIVNNANLRSNQEIIQACDAAYCLHWGLSQAALDGYKSRCQPSLTVVVERRRALEWILSKQDWDDIALDT